MATLRQTFSDIADAIRAKGVSGTMKPIEMASKIGQIQTGGGGGGQDYGYLTFTAEEITILTLKQNGGIAPYKLLKSTDGVTWTKWENPSTNGIVLNDGQSVHLKADEDASNTTATGDNDFNSYSSTGRIKCNGSLMPEISLNPGTNDYSYFVSKLFRNCTTLTRAPELPATTLANSCYFGTFANCSSLVEAPELPAKDLDYRCYYYIFVGCTSLSKAPSLPATTLKDECYKGMFQNCKSLVEAPTLPATTLKGSCYQYMFNGCTSLTSAPELPATTVANSCYYEMFNGCTSLKRIKMNASSGSWGSSMFNGCTSLELVDVTGSTGVPQLENVNNFSDTNDTYKIVVPDSLYDTWIAATNWASIASHIMKQSDWNAAHPDDIL